MPAVPVDFHRVIVRAPSSGTASGWRMVTPPEDAFDPARVRVSPVGEVRPGDTVIGTVQPHYDQQLQPLDRAQWVGYFSHASQPQEHGARPFDPAHCDWCTHNAYVLGIGAGSGYWTVDGCTTYRPDTLLLVIPAQPAA
ncbi:hypothetical protein ACFY2M_19295 [Streptomyces sp. NPDC001276]|uniref:hypothetical protein n=1 Tax=Streptomyces sp. NPDC001276 TaxID=3364555 RepID=UPI003693C527